MTFPNLVRPFFVVVVIHFSFPFRIYISHICVFFFRSPSLSSMRLPRSSPTLLPLIVQPHLHIFSSTCPFFLLYFLPSHSYLFPAPLASLPRPTSLLPLRPLPPPLTVSLCGTLLTFTSVALRLMNTAAPSTLPPRPSTILNTQLPPG